MSDAVRDSRLVEWVRELFADPSAESMIRWMLVAWLVATIGIILLDRLGSTLLGRSKPLTQEPPALARTWRWRRHTSLPTSYSMMPAGTLVTPPPSTAPESIPLATERPELEIEEQPVAPLIPSNRPDIADNRFWEGLVSTTHPLFGYENTARLELGRPPERFNPVLGRVEQIDRDPATGAISWPGKYVSLFIGFGRDDTTESE